MDSDVDIAVLGVNISVLVLNNRVARNMRTHYGMETDGQRFVCLKSGISILRRYL